MTMTKRSGKESACESMDAERRSVGSSRMVKMGIFIWTERGWTPELVAAEAGMSKFDDFFF
jgi:hypothetical protein